MTLEEFESRINALATGTVSDPETDGQYGHRVYSSDAQEAAARLSDLSVSIRRKAWSAGVVSAALALAARADRVANEIAAGAGLMPAPPQARWPVAVNGAGNVVQEVR